MNLREAAQKIKEVANIVEVIGEHVKLKRTGRNYVGLCPFHSDRKPSFTVSEEKQIFRCFGCGAGGDVIAFYMKFHNVGFAEAVRELARRYNLDLREEASTPEKGVTSQKREALFRLNERVKRFFEQMLWAAKAGEEARAYLRERGLSIETAKAFGLGFAPDSYDSLASHLRLSGEDPNLAVEAGVLATRQDGSFYDRFRHRIIFPIYDLNGRIAGFGGRVIGPGEPKYLNTPETLIYHKGRLLYGLFQTRSFIRNAGFGLVVEGYMDLLALFEAGVREVVATLGTALTPQHVRLMKGLADKWYLVFDADEAGVKAACRAAPLFFNEGLFPQVITLPPGEDPDSFVRRFGAEAFAQEKEKALPVFDFLLKTLMARLPSGPEGRVSLIKELRPVFEALKDPVLYDLYVARLADVTKASEASIKRALKVGVKCNLGNNVEDVRYFERTVLEFLVFHPEFLPELEAEGLAEIFTQDLYRRLFDEIAHLSRTKGHFGIEELSFADLELQALVSEIVLSPPAFEEEVPPAKVAEEIKSCLRKRRREAELSALIKAIREAEEEGRLEEAQRLLKQYQELRCNL